MTGANFPEHLGLPDQQATAIQARWNTTPGVREVLRLRGLERPHAPSYPIPEVTAAELQDPAHLGAAKLAQLLPWHRYLGRLLAESRGELLRLENESKDIEARIRREARGENINRKSSEKLSLQDVADIIIGDSRHSAITLEHQQAEQERWVIQAEWDAVDRSIKTLARQPDTPFHHPPPQRTPQAPVPPPTPPPDNTLVERATPPPYPRSSSRSVRHDPLGAPPPSPKLK